LKICYFCRGEPDTIHVGVRDNPKINVLKCKECGLVYLSSFEHIDDEFYEDGQMLGENFDIYSYLEATKSDDVRRAEYLKSTLKGKRILDVGCGGGGFLNLTKDDAKVAHGVELNKTLCEHINNRGHVNVKCFQSIDNIDEKYDIITLFHVIEHFPDPISILRKLSSHLVDGGCILLETPNSDDALLSMYGSSSFADFTYWSCHLFLFDPQTLESLVKSLDMNARCEYIKQVQRYPLSNHLHWLAKSKPGGHEKWCYLSNELLDMHYESALAALGRCDTLMASIVFN